MPEIFIEDENIEEPEAVQAANMKRGSKNNDPLSSEEEGQLTIDVYQTDDDIVIKSAVAGVEEKDLDITINNDMVTIRGRREPEEKVKSQDYYYQECYWGAFSRSVILPTEIEADKANASLKNGILTIRLPKITRTRTKKVKVKIE
jgi:HSP20 family protein